MIRPATRQDLIREIVKPGSVGAEIGVFCGDFSTQLLKCHPRRLFLVDPWHKYPGFAHDSINNGDFEYAYKRTVNDHAAEIASGQVMIVRDFSAPTARAFYEAHHCLDWVYIDANHLYEFVLEDHRLWQKCLAPGGVLMGHDYRQDNPPGCGVRQAVDDFCRSEGWEMTHLTLDYGNSPEWENIPSYCLHKQHTT
jgi:hypothetical protein